jgi:hypothetical protein
MENMHDQPYPALFQPSVIMFQDASRLSAVRYGLENIVTGRLSTTNGWSPLPASTSHAAIDNIYSFTGGASGTSMSSTYVTAIDIATNKVVYTSGRLKVTGAGVTSITIRLRGSTSITTGQQTLKTITSPSEGVWIPFTGSAVCQATMTGKVAIAFVVAATETNGIKIEIDGIYGFMVFDTSTNIGSGNEPSATEMDAILAADGTTYWENTRSILCNPQNKYFWYDYSGNGRHIKLNNFGYTGTTSNWISHPWALNFDGMNDYIRYVNPSLNAANTSFSLMCIFNIPNTVGNKLNYMTSDETPSAALNLYAVGSTLTAEGSDSVAGSASVTTTIQASRWYMACVVYNQADKKVRLYLNGNLIGTSGALANGLRAITRIKAGTNTSEAAYSSQDIGVIAPFNRALSTSEVQQLFNADRRNYGI